MSATAVVGFLSWNWLRRNGDEVLQRIVEHLVLTGIAVGVGLALAAVLSIVALRYRRLYAPITWVTGILYTIPSLALFAFLVPVTGLTITTAEIGLVSYTLLILIRNIVSGIDGVPAEIREAALGMGYTRRRMFWDIEVRLALPAILAGIRIATVTVIGLVTVTAVIGLGGLGSFILRGLDLFHNAVGRTQIVVGTGLSVVLAVALDQGLVLLERALTPWARRAGP